MESLLSNFMQVYERIWIWLKSLIGDYKSSKLVIPFFIVLNLGITLPLAAFLNIWIDEAYSLHTTGKDIGYAINQALYFELQPPLYFILLNSWRSFNSSIFFARLFSVICITLTLYVAASLSKKFIKKINPVWVVASVALNPFAIWAAVEIRLYAFLVLLSALLLLSFFNGYLAEVPRARARWFYILLSTLALYTQYYSAFLLIANGFVLLILRHWLALRNYFIDMVVVGLIFAPMLSVIPHQVAEHTATVSSSSSFFKMMKFIALRILEYNLGNPWILSGKERRTLLVLGIILLFVIILRNKLKIISPNLIAIWSITVTLSLAFIAIQNRVGLELLTNRHTTILFLPSILSIFALLSLIQNREVQKKVILIWIVFTLFFNTISVYVKYHPLVKDGDSARVASYIMSSEKPDQPILVFNAEGALPLSYYYSGQNKIIPIPKENDFKFYDLHNFIIHNENELFLSLSRVPGKHQYIWLVTNGIIKFFNVDYNQQILEEFVRKYYSTEITQTFVDPSVKVRLLRKI